MCTGPSDLERTVFSIKRQSKGMTTYGMTMGAIVSDSRPKLFCPIL